ncbi:MAG: electron transfer flavoprotein subunit alpha/FixB family protein [Planctomycetes bacterium]|nr:electron transfer flavoprotein subunit alpha/FixB family protein [Planctomycetota bacterium]
MTNPILVFAETQDSKLKKSAIEVISEAKRQSDNLKAEVVAMLIGSGVEPLAKDAASYGAAKVIIIDGPDFKSYTTGAYTQALMAAVEKTKPQAIILSATSNGKDLAGSVAAELKTTAAQDCISLTYDNAFVARKPVYAGKAIITVKIAKQPAVITLRPKVFPASAPDASKSVSTEKLPVALSADSKRVTVKETVAAAKGKVSLTEADIIVSGGRGMKGPENFKILEELAGVVSAAVGASRAAVDSGWRTHDDQVGQTGKTVCPTLYVACGISGAIQHLAGMSSSKYIVAINKDPEAPIFKVANYGVVGDLFEVVPALCKELKK